MSEKPILFNGKMVRAILEGRKTQTRRVIKPQPVYDSFIHLGAGISGLWRGYPADQTIPIWEAYCPYGRPGDQLWVRETFCPVDDREFGGKEWVDYRATPKYSSEHPAGWEIEPGNPNALKWKPSIFMPRKFSRIQLEITGVRVERIQEITDEDIVAEGGCIYGAGAWEWFIPLWDGINAKRGFSFESNPWVWVVEFRVL